MSAIHHLQIDGQTKVTNRNLEDYLRAFTQDSWDKWDEFGGVYDEQRKECAHRRNTAFLELWVTSQTLPRSGTQREPTTAVGSFGM